MSTNFRYIYFIIVKGYEAIRPCKIGISKNPCRRLQQIQSNNHKKLELVTKIKVNNGYKVEKKIHLSNSNNKIHGEWYNLDIKTIHKIAESIKEYN